ncbi:hypothetical protein COCHEDRAFT_1201824 [Bipolaris maydis C5]|uniref:Uncharacterized protein n=1 Tax=Cochliobolus heterostrophus (strain C5 / ATCC 48332 / race O) TaxID=701091 RepID=M2T8W8_COCH5|nr:hypothetical protein COCHEDRAFT_1201824 [Bipolaris maydis C5]KAJ5026796.1 hypothetical protein J3E73DRAFT_44284 [Bipolaris maydis]KAJ6197566.1 hypothetical protein J3E72DRAFT_431367 [Bipolaris maydis]KAJ6209450.1 hypothetical protein PSV09DRAFT_1201824 [Bipolaris maydis]
MSHQVHQHISFTEPSVAVSSCETDSDLETLQPSHPRRHTLKREVSKSFLHTCSYLGKRRKRSQSVPERSIDCPYLVLPPGGYVMSSSSSNVSSNHSVLTTPLPSPAIDDTEHGLEHGRRQSQVAELLNRLNFRLKRLFGSRRGSVEDGDPSVASFDTRRSSLSSNLRGPTDSANIDCTPEYQMWYGSFQLPNVSEFFDANGDVGPSSFYNTADWNAFQETLQAQGNAAIQTHVNNHRESNADMDLDRLDWFRAYGTQGSGCEPRTRKDSFFSFGGFLRSRRSSKVDKGKGRMNMDNDTAVGPPDEMALLSSGSTRLGVETSCLAEIGVLPRVSMETMLPLSPKESQDVPQAEFSSLESSTPSLHCSGSSTPPSEEAQERQVYRAQRAGSCITIPLLLGEQAGDAKAACGSPASSVCSMDDQPVPIRPATPVLVPTIVSSPSPLTPIQSLSLGPRQHEMEWNRCSSSKCRSRVSLCEMLSDEAPRAVCCCSCVRGGGNRASGGLGLRKSLDDRCWWDDDDGGKGGATRKLHM